MSSDFKNKLAASVQLFGSDCPAVVKEVGEGFRADPDLRTKSIDKVKVKGNNATLIAHSTYLGADVRTKVSLERRAADEAWMLAGDQQLDDVAPSAPLTAYRDYSSALSDGDGTRVCALSTAAGKALIGKMLPESHSGGTCEGAVPFLAVAASKLPRTDIVGGEAKGETATLYGLQSDGSGGWVFREFVMKREGGKWLFDRSLDLGVAPARKMPGGPVA
ncbi:MAG: hypothetical protein HYX29_08870 [Solirubrobacterales bacterium]|nr:hypothetical protein [Solirubrobacterales bacterium]